MATMAVTGGAGFIGSHLVRALVREGHRVRVIDNLSAGSREAVHPDAEFHFVDIRDGEKLTALFKGVDSVFHLAALPQVQYSIEHPKETHEVNATGTLNVFLAATAASVRRVVLASSCAVYGEQLAQPFREDMTPVPKSPYGLQKYIGERYASLFSQLYPLETVSLRFFNVYGPGQASASAYSMVVSLFAKQKEQGLPLTITGDGEQRRDFVHINDVVAALVGAQRSPKVGKGEVVNIGTGIAVSINELADAVGGPRVYISARFEPRAACADIHRAKILLDWEPQVSLSDGMTSLKFRVPVSVS